jgi:antitoxin ParD1/3/4
MPIKLSPDLEQYVNEKLSSGRYKCEDDLIAEAIRVMRSVDKMLPSAQDDLRREIQLGLDDLDEGRVSDWNVDQMKERLLEKLRAKKAS